MSNIKDEIKSVKNRGSGCYEVTTKDDVSFYYDSEYPQQLTKIIIGRNKSPKIKNIYLHPYLGATIGGSLSWTTTTNTKNLQIEEALQALKLATQALEIWDNLYNEGGL